MFTTRIVRAQLSWHHGLRVEHFPNQPLPERAGGIETVVIDVNDSQGRPKELRMALGFLRTFSKADIQEYLKSMHIAQQLENVPSSVIIIKPLESGS